MANKKIAPEAWVFLTSVATGLVLMLALNMRGCKNCNEQKAVTGTTKAKADTVWVNRNVVTINGNDNVVNINQGNANKIENKVCAKPAAPVKKKPAEKPAAVTQKPVVKAPEQKPAKTEDDVVIVDFDQTIIDCYGRVTVKYKRAYFTRRDGKLTTDSIVDIKQPTLTATDTVCPCIADTIAVKVANTQSR